MNLIKLVKDFWNYLPHIDDDLICIGCGKKHTKSHVLRDYLECKCISNILDYNLYNEKITPETRTYFFNLQKVKK